MLACVSCDALGSFYQPDKGRTTCEFCAVNTQRYVGILSGANKTACQCKEGANAPCAPTVCLMCTGFPVERAARSGTQRMLCLCVHMRLFVNTALELLCFAFVCLIHAPALDCRLLHSKRRAWRGAFHVKLVAPLVACLRPCTFGDRLLLICVCRRARSVRRSHSHRSSQRFRKRQPITNRCKLQAQLGVCVVVYLSGRFRWKVRRFRIGSCGHL